MIGINGGSSPQYLSIDPHDVVSFVCLIIIFSLALMLSAQGASDVREGMQFLENLV